MEKNNLLATWLVDECNKRNLSWAEASRRAGISQNTISQIVNGTPAGPKRLYALADYFGVPHSFIFQLAGLLPEPKDGDHDIIVDRYAEELIGIWLQLRDIDPDSAQRLIDIAIMQAQMVLLAVQAGSKDNETEKEDAAKGPTTGPT